MNKIKVGRYGSNLMRVGLTWPSGSEPQKSLKSKTVTPSDAV
jgi:hypothetical protein